MNAAQGALRLEGVDAKNHDVFRELTRTKQYFDKIKKAETPPEPRPEGAGVDTQAAIRFIKADLVCALCCSFQYLSTMALFTDPES